MEKSYVGLETKACIVCGKEYDTGTVLLDRRLLNTLKRKNCTGYGICEEHQKVLDEGYVILVEVEEECANPVRTGELVFLRREAAKQIFNVPIKDLAFTTPDVTMQIKQMAYA